MQGDKDYCAPCRNVLGLFPLVKIKQTDISEKGISNKMPSEFWKLDMISVKAISGSMVDERMNSPSERFSLKTFKT